jgi:chromosome partitioning protein
MRIIALMNQKGGVGKTTTTVNLGAALGEMGKRVCLIDLDPQAHLTINYGVEPSATMCSLYNVLCEERSFLEAVHKIDDRMALVPSSIDLAGAEIELVSVLGRERILKERLEASEHDFDFILLDCPPSLGLLTINALSVADEVIIPMQPHFLALQGVGKLLETVALVNKRMNPKLKVTGIVLTMFDSQTKLSTEVVSDLQGFIDEAKEKKRPWSDARVFNSKIRRNIKLAESPSFGQTILAYEPLSNGAVDYRALAREVAEMFTPVGATSAPAAATPVQKPMVAPAKAPVSAVSAPTRVPAIAAKPISPAPIVIPVPAPSPAASPKAKSPLTKPLAAVPAAPVARPQPAAPPPTISKPGLPATPTASPPQAARVMRVPATPAPAKPAVAAVAPTTSRPAPAPVAPIASMAGRTPVSANSTTPPATAPVRSPVRVTVNTTIDQSKLTAAKVDAPSPKGSLEEVA